MVELLLERMHMRIHEPPHGVAQHHHFFWQLPGASWILFAQALIGGGRGHVQTREAAAARKSRALCNCGSWLASYCSIHSWGSLPHDSPMRSRCPELNTSAATTSPTKMVFSSLSSVPVIRHST